MTWLIVKTSEMIFLALDTSAASMTLAASKTSTASMTSKAFFSQNISLFWKLIDETQMSKTPERATTFFKNLRSILVGHFGLQSVSYQVETPCNTG